MLGNIARKVFGSRNDRLIKAYRKVVAQVNANEAAFEQLSDDDLKGKISEFKQRYQEGVSLEEMLPEVFAIVREASKRVLGMRHYDVQLIGAMVLNDGNIAEMRTGEGKTLMATLAVVLNAISGKGVHVVTVNDYLASRDAAWMAQLYGFLGLTTGTIVSGMDHAARQEAYAADITYGTNNEFGFDYLRDNMAFSKEQRVQRGLNFAIVDEVDSILIDEARTPLIISGPTNETSELYRSLDALVPNLVRQEDEESEGDYFVDEKAKQVFLSEEGHGRAEELLREAGLLQPGASLYDTASISILHHLNAALRAHALFQKDVDYLVKNGEVVIVDEFTGRSMPGRRWSDGLHQAIEAKEGVAIQNENQTLASITFQNYFRMYEKLSGMTGTADTEAFELQQIYGLEVVVIPTHREMVRNDMNDLIYLNQKGKFNAIIKDIKYCVEHGRPVLVGTTSIEASELLASMLKEEKIGHEVLNAKQHEREATIVAQAGRPGSVTIATNMAGRGTDIVLGGSLDNMVAELGDDAGEEKIKAATADWEALHESVVDAGGLHIIGTERHESRRIDNQLRGRAGRQGDPGSSRFYISLDDNLMRIFASDRMRALMERFGMEEDEAIENSLVTRSIESAQRKVEAHNFDIRKNLLDYDNVTNDQRKVIYEQRNELLEAEEIADNIKGLLEDVVGDLLQEYIPQGSIEDQWDVEGLETALEEKLGMILPVKQWLDEDDQLYDQALFDKVFQEVEQVYSDKEAAIGPEMMRRVEKDIMLQVVDNHWKDHLAAMDYLRQSVGLRGYAQKDPKQEYKREAFEAFQELLERIKLDTISFLMRMQLTAAQPPVEPPPELPEEDLNFQHPNADSVYGEEAVEASSEDKGQTPFVRGDKVGRNEPCPCGSGKKYKHCHGKL
ncbi:MAG: preprotein translocase subunit SecA [bacterium]